jgi:hypothetical protein
MYFFDTFRCSWYIADRQYLEGFCSHIESCNIYFVRNKPEYGDWSCPQNIRFNPCDGKKSVKLTSSDEMSIV